MAWTMRVLTYIGVRKARLDTLRERRGMLGVGWSARPTKVQTVVAPTLELRYSPKRRLDRCRWASFPWRCSRPLDSTRLALRHCPAPHGSASGSHRHCRMRARVVRS